MQLLVQTQILGIKKLIQMINKSADTQIHICAMFLQMFVIKQFKNKLLGRVTSVNQTN